MNQSTGKVQDFERGVRLKAERERLGFSLVEFGKMVGASKGSQILYEKGSPPTADYLVAAGAIGVDIIFILTGISGQNVEPRVGTQVRRQDGTLLATYEGQKVALRPDQDRLMAALESVEEGLSGRQVPARVKAELTIAAYDLLTEATAENRARVIRLVKGG